MNDLAAVRCMVVDVWQTQICRVMAGQRIKDEDWKACFLLDDNYYSRC